MTSDQHVHCAFGDLEELDARATPGVFEVFVPDDYLGPNELPGVGISAMGAGKGQTVVWYADRPETSFQRDQDAYFMAALVNAWRAGQLVPAGSAPVPRSTDWRSVPLSLLCDLRDDLSAIAGATNSFCEVCEKHAPKDPEGAIIGPVPHDPACVLGRLEALLAPLPSGAPR